MLQRTEKLEKDLINSLVNSMILIWVFLSGFALFLSLSRADEFGWGLKESLHIIVFLTILIVGFLRYRLTTQLKASVFIAIQLSVGITDMFAFGIIAPAVFLIPIVGVMFALFYSPLTTYLFNCIVLIFISFIGFAFLNNWLVLELDTQTIFNSGEHWALYVICLAIFMFFLSLSIIKYKSNLHDLINEIEAQKKEIEHLANHDPLTGLPVLSLIVNAYLKSNNNTKSNNNLALLFIDLDEFKKINDKFGHEAGDRCLKHVALQLKNELSENQFATRIGGDEFLVMVDYSQEKDFVTTKAESLYKAITTSFEFEQNMIKIEASIGIAFSDIHGNDFNQVKLAADKAMYKAKRHKKIHILVAEIE